MNRERIAVSINDFAGKYWPMPADGAPYAAIIQQASADNGVPFDLLARQLKEESDFNPGATNPSGAQGIAQLIPKFYPGIDPFDPAQAIPTQASALADHYDRFGSWAAALAAYNWGEGNVHKAVTDYGDSWLLNAPTETRKYVGQILTDVPLEPLPVGALV